MGRFSNIVNGFQLLTFFSKYLLLYFRDGSEYTSEYGKITDSSGIVLEMTEIATWVVL